MQKVRGHLHSDSTPSWPTDHVARKGREMRHRCAPVLHAPRGINAGRARCNGSPSCPGPRQGSQFFLKRQPQRMIRTRRVD